MQTMRLKDIEEKELIEIISQKPIIIILEPPRLYFIAPRALAGKPFSSADTKRRRGQIEMCFSLT
jgi:hypothetical protein